MIFYLIFRVICFRAFTALFSKRTGVIVERNEDATEIFKKNANGKDL